MNWMLGPLRESIITILIVAGPIIIAAAVAGLLIGILQAATQIQDQAIPSAIKIIGIMLLMIFLGVWMFSYLARFTEKTIGKAFSMVLDNRTPLSMTDRGISDLKPNPLENSTLPEVDTAPQMMPSNYSYSSPPSQFTPVNSPMPNAQISPPVQAFSNVLRSRPSAELNYPSQQASIYPGQYNSYQQPQTYRQPQEPNYSQQYGGAYPQTYQNPNGPHAYSNSELNLPPQQPIIPSAPPVNKVVLKKKPNVVKASNDSPYQTKQQPMTIFRPVIPGQENNSPDVSQTNAERLSPPSKAQSNGTEWW
jgi:type III secretory pathway component EscS